MDPAAHRAFTLHLRDRLAEDPRVAGLVALGSTSRHGRAPDNASDHDVFIVAVPGHAAALRDDPSYWPRDGAIVLALRDTPHGGRIVWDDGHLAEFAVFEPDELAQARAEAGYEILLDRTGVDVASRMDAVVRATAAERPSAPDLRFHLGTFVTLLLVAALRWRRGERLSARAFISWAVLHHLAPLLAAPGAIDPLRRFEERHPREAAIVDDALRATPPEGARALLELGEELFGERPEWPRDAARAVLSRLAHSGADF